MTKTDAPYAIRLQDYRQTSYSAQKTELTIALDPDLTLITSKVSYHHRRGEARSLLLVGKDLTLLAVAIDGKTLEISALDWSSEHLRLEGLPERFVLEIKTSVSPRSNTALEGIYLSQGKFYSQCEPEGFRRLTYYLDRPDVMAEFWTTLIADRTRYPVLLSNGNLIESGAGEGGLHYAVWHDPFPKPSYLFALVAGQLSRVQDAYTTRDGRRVELQIYVEPENLEKCAFAMEAIKRAMKWDEDVYGLCYDLDLFMVVAVSDFNMGAMENKGLNIFNAKYVLASPETATDADFEGILAVIGHEYFHNWTGNRVTLRDWFQLSLKEGLTVFRDQSFSADQGSFAVKRIQDVRALRESQFPEDRGPMSHPVRPESYIEINNFYTATVYSKGAEIIRMLYGMLGRETYHRAMRAYFETYDGQAVTIEQFLAVMSSASGMDLDQFKRWYQQAGTPTVKVHSSFDLASKTTLLHCEQSQGGAPQTLPPLQIPLRVALFSEGGRPLASVCEGRKSHEHVLLLSERRQLFKLEGSEERAIPSVLRQFSAPVVLESELTRAQLLILLAHETDAFNRYEAAQTLFIQLVAARCADLRRAPASPAPLDPLFIDALRAIIVQSGAEPRLAAMTILPPSVDFLVQRLPEETLDDIFAARAWLISQLANELRDDLHKVYRDLAAQESNGLDRDSIGRRELKNACLGLLTFTQRTEDLGLAGRQSSKAQNMTDAVAALTALASWETPARYECFDAFYDRWKNDPLVLDKWFAMQASSHHPQVLAQVRGLLEHKEFDLRNPNRVYSVFRQFARSVPHGFHSLSGEGYRLVADYALRIDQSNPQVAATICGSLSRFSAYDRPRQLLMRAELMRMSEHKGLSRDVFEVLSKSLAEP